MSEKRITTGRTTRRTRGAASPVAELQKLVNTLIRENRQLKQRLARLSAKDSGRGLDLRGLSGLARRVERAISGSKPAKRKPATKRPPASPEVAEKRRQALAKARQVRADKRAAAEGS